MLARSLLAAGVVVLALAPGCGGAAPCTAEEHDLGDSAVGIRRLGNTTPTTQVCARTQLRVVANEADLRAFYDQVGLVSSESVDFAKERVIVREGVGAEGIAWAAAKGPAGYVGLLACGQADRRSCMAEAVAVPAQITSVEARTCDTVGCGPVPQR